MWKSNQLESGMTGSLSLEQKIDHSAVKTVSLLSTVTDSAWENHI